MALALSVLAAGAQARKIREYKLHEQEDRGAPFGMTVGPDHTVYTLLPRRDGNWVLSRVKGWWQEKPDEMGILVEGFSARDPVSGFDQMDLAVTPDGKYVVTMLTAAMRVAADDPYPMDMIVEVVRLDGFEVMITQHMRSLGMRGMLRGGMDREGKLLVRSEMAGGDDNGSPAPYVTWFAVTVPDVKAQLECSYQAAADAKDTQPMEAACGEFARKDGYGSAAELAKDAWPEANSKDAGAPGSAPPSGAPISKKDSFRSAGITIDGQPLTLVVLNGVELQVYGEK